MSGYVCVWLGSLSSSITSNTLPHLSIWYLFGYCLCYYCCCSLIHSPTALISSISHQLIQANVIIVTRRLMRAVEMRNGLWRGVLQAVACRGEFSPTLPHSTTHQKSWPIKELELSRKRPGKFTPHVHHVAHWLPLRSPSEVNGKLGIKAYMCTIYYTNMHLF